jgi:hypothetical protein
LILENLPAIERWRDGLEETQRRRLNHPNAIWAHWRRATKTEIAAPTRRHVVKGLAAKGHGKAIHWPGMRSGAPHAPSAKSIRRTSTSWPGGRSKLRSETKPICSNCFPSIRQHQRGVPPILPPVGGIRPIS